MKLLKKPRFLIAAVAIVIVSTVLYAAFTFNTSTDSQPTSTLATFALSKNDFSASGGYAYQPWFENGAWQGDLIEYYVCGQDDEATLNCKVGDRSTDAVVGSNPAQAGASNWMARATFDAKEGTNPITTAYWQEKSGGRHIFTVKTGSTGTQTQVDFLWNQLSDPQKLALDSNIADPTNLFSQGLAASVATGSAYDSLVLNFIRGDRENEKKYTGGTYRVRYNLLGDIINSNPVYIGAPRESYNLPGFPDFKSTKTGRAPRIAIGANDGMLHVFDASDGSEVYAYIPSMLILDPDVSINSNKFPVVGDPATSTQLAVSKLNNLRQIPYEHTYFVDGQLTAASAAGANCTTSACWKTVLTGGLGAGAKGLFALDVTYPTATGTKVLFEKTGDNIGHIYGQPVVARLGDEKWYIVTGNGFGANDNSAQLLLISLDSPYTITSLPACEGTGCTPVAEGLAAPALVDTDGNSTVDLAFAGDDSGNMWRFNLRYDTDTNTFNLTTTKIFAGSPDQPITSAPEIGAWQGGGYLVYFGTGTIQHTWSTDPPSDTPTQAIYGIWDSATTTNIVDQTLSSTIVDPNKLYTETPNAVFDNNGQTLTATDGTSTSCSLPTDTTKLTAVRYFENDNTVDFCNNDSNCAQGWRVLLDSDGEQVLGSPKLRAGRLTVVTNNRENLRGDNWLMSLDYLTGGDGNQVIFDANTDDSINDCDRETGGYPPVGLGLGDGNVSQPVYAHLAYEQDQMYINGLRLPVILSKSLLGGSLDVETDSPFGGSTAPNDNSQESEGYGGDSMTANDGAGRGVDGHFHHYDKVNGVTYVDLFQLEPRRGEASLAAKTTAYNGSSCDKGYIPVTGSDGKISGCVEEVVPELNRAYDTLTDTSMPKSEVYQSTDKTLLDDKNKKFIVVLANADLSPAATLQIGCREWKVKDYQDMLTEQLEDNVKPADLIDYETYDDKLNGTARNGPGSLVFTLDGIAKESGGVCDKDNPPTVRVKFNYRSILDNGVMGTRPQCVLGLHDYHDKVCYTDEQVLSHAPPTSDDFPASYNPLDPTDATEPYDSFSYSTCQDSRFASEADRISQPTLAPPVGYVRNPDRNLHITESTEGAGGKYRWRNGALTVQFIDASKFTVVSNCTASIYNDYCPLQDPNTLTKSTKGKKVRFGGTYARAFEIKSVSGKDVMTPYAADDSSLTGNGLLYESTIFWHYGELAEELRRAPPSSIPCYGDTSYNGALVQEVGGLTLGEYDCLIKGGPQCTNTDGTDNTDGIGSPTDSNSLYSQYVKALEDLQLAKNSGDEGLINQAVLALGKLLENNPALATYDRYRKYAPGHVPESKLYPIDKGSAGDGGEPAPDVKLKEKLDKQSLGPNLTAGRRSWIDLSD